MEKINSLFSGLVALLISFFGGSAPIANIGTSFATTSPSVITVVEREKMQSPIQPSSSLVVVPQKGGSIESIKVKDNKKCEEIPFTLGTSSDSYLTLLSSGCKNDDYGFHSWFFNDGRNKKHFVLVYDGASSKCNCSGAVGYFDYNNVYKENSTSHLNRSDVVYFKEIYKELDTDQGQTSYVFNDMRYLINAVGFPTTTLYFLDPISKKVYPGITVYNNQAQTFCISEMNCNMEISFSSSSKSISVSVYTYATVTKMFIDEPKKETVIINLPR